MGSDLCGSTPATLENSTEEPFALFGLDLNQFDLRILPLIKLWKRWVAFETNFTALLDCRALDYAKQLATPQLPLKGKGLDEPGAHFYALSPGFWSHLHGLSSLLRLGQQLDGDGPAVLHGVLQVNEGVAHVATHAALPADRHRAGLAEEQEHLDGHRNFSLTADF